ncbi:MAG TPA: hypothetical protein VKA21_07795, partial [Candidatus Binatia bacterium]|nr:hypothetical protein [Candidatus Binatia bacterium]
MRGNMLQTWTPAWLVLTALLAVGVVATTTGRVTPAEGRPLVEPTNRIAHCALPAALVQRAERARVP